MNLTVRPSTPLSPGAAIAAAGPALKWMWAAIGVLGVSVLALGATLVWQQQRAPAVAAAPAMPPAQLAAAPRTPESEIIEEKRPSARDQYVQPAINSVANGRAP